MSPIVYDLVVIALTEYITLSALDAQSCCCSCCHDCAAS